MQIADAFARETRRGRGAEKAEAVAWKHYSILCDRIVTLQIANPRASSDA